jgi:hypothetical protein
MRMPWHRSKDALLELLELLDAESELNARHRPAASTPHTDAASPPPQAIMKPGIAWDSRPLMLAITWLVEDPANPRTEFPAAALDELAEDIRQRGILQPLVVHPQMAKAGTASTSAPNVCTQRFELGSMRFRSSFATCPPIATPKSPRTRSATV